MVSGVGASSTWTAASTASLSLPASSASSLATHARHAMQKLQLLHSRSGGSAYQDRLWQPLPEPGGRPVVSWPQARHLYLSAPPYLRRNVRRFEPHISQPLWPGGRGRTLSRVRPVEWGRVDAAMVSCRALSLLCSIWPRARVCRRPQTRFFPFRGRCVRVWAYLGRLGPLCGRKRGVFWPVLP